MLERHIKNSSNQVDFKTSTKTRKIEALKKHLKIWWSFNDVCNSIRYSEKQYMGNSSLFLNLGIWDFLILFLISNLF